MTAVDTNVLVRFLVADDDVQTQTVYKLFKDAEARRGTFLVSLLVVLELVWVLESVYEIHRREIIDTVESLLKMTVLKVESPDVVRRVLEDARKNTCDLSDLLIGHVASAAGCDSVLSFDKKACRHPLFRMLHA